jgi:hypothetical protein
MANFNCSLKRKFLTAFTISLFRIDQVIFILERTQTLLRFPSFISHSRGIQAQSEVELMKLLPETAKNSQTHERRVSQDAVRLNLTLPDRVKEKLLRLKDFWAHVDPTMDYVEIIERAADIALEKIDPTLRQSTVQRATESAVETNRTLWTRAGSQCEYFDEKGGRRCSCRFGLERDHVITRAKGGANDISNLRLLCKTHNLMMARRHFGSENVEHRIRAGKGGRTGPIL